MLRSTAFRTVPETDPDGLPPLFAVAPFMLPGYFWGANDARHHVYFLFEYDRVVQDGIWWPRWSPDFAFGYGYPFFNIYGPLSHFLAELLHHFLRLSYTGAIETVFAFSIVASAGAMYAFVRVWTGRQGAVISSLVYTYAPYHLLNLYVRANLAESMAFVWLPLALLALRQSLIRRSIPWTIGLALCYAGLMLTSNLVFVLFTPLLALYFVALLIAERTVAPRGGRLWAPAAWLWHLLRPALLPLMGLIAGLGLSAIFWLPMVMERQYVLVEQWFDGRYDYRGNFVYFFQLFSPQWGFGASISGPNDPIGFQLGIAPFALAVLGVCIAWPLLRRQRWEVACFIVAGVLATFVGLRAGRILWELPLLGTLLGFAQFPWRWFSVTLLCLSILAGLSMPPTGIGRRAGLTVPLLALILIILMGSFPLLQVEITEPAEGPVSLAALMHFQRSADEMTGSTAWVTKVPTWSPMAEYYTTQAETGATVKPVDSKLDYGIFDYATFAASSVAHSTIMEEIYYYNQSGRDRTIIFNHFYYPGWNAYLLDGKHGAIVKAVDVIPESEGSLGRMTVAVPEGEGYLLLQFEDTPPRIIGRVLSIATLSFLTILALAVTWRQRLRKQQPSSSTDL